MSNQNPFGGGPALPFLIIILGLLGILVSLLFLLAFVVLLGYYLYRVEKRLRELEGHSSLRAQSPK